MSVLIEDFKMVSETLKIMTGGLVAIDQVMMRLTEEQKIALAAELETERYVMQNMIRKLKGEPHDPSK